MSGALSIPGPLSSPTVHHTPTHRTGPGSSISSSTTKVHRAQSDNINLNDRLRKERTNSSLNLERSDSSSSKSTSANKQDFERAKNVIFTIVVIAINIFAIWKVGYLWSVSFFVGMVFRYEVKHRISDFADSIMAKTALSVSILIPGTLFFYFFHWPAALTAQAVLSGADTGSRFALALESYLRGEGGICMWIFKA